MSGAGFNPFAGGEILKVSPTTEPQIEILTSAKISDEANLAFNEAAALNLEGVLDETLLKQCFVAVVNRHEVLNATFSSRADEICLQGQAWNAFTVLDYSSESLDEANQQKIALYQQIATSPMDLENGPLFFVWLLKMPNQQSSVVIAAHHLVCDGWSFGIVLQDLLKAYQNNGSLEPLSDDESFFYFAEKQKASKILNQDEDYWREKMTPFPAPLDLPLDQPRPLERPFQAKRLDYRLADDVVALLPKLAAASKGSVVNVALAAYVALLQRLSNNDDVVVGLPVAGQAALNQLNLVGHLVQLLPIRIDSNEDIAFDELIGRVKNAVMDATEHPNFTFGNLVKDAAVERNRVPLVSVLFNMDQAMPALDFNGIAGQVETIPRAADSFELFFNIVPSDQEWILEVTYSSVLYSETSILSWLHTYEDILREAAKQQSISLKQLRYAGQAYQQLVQRIDNWNNTEKDYALDTLTLDSLIAKACQEHAEHTAVFFEEHSLSYTDFNLKVSQLAKQLVDEGLQREQPVAVLMQRSEKLPVVLSAIMKAGGAYLPLDPEHPPERLAYIVASSNTVKAIVDEKFAHLLPAAIPCLNITKGWDQLDQYDQGLVGSLALPSSLAYIIYTSGSTGKPKGVMVEHQSVCNRLLWMQDDFSLDRNDKVLQKTPYTFDVSVWEFFMPLTIGASLVMAKPDGHKNPDYLIDIIKQHGISLVHFVPSMLSLFLDNEDAATCSSLKRVICSGEALNHKHQKSFFEVLPNASLYNFYGPTEAAIEVTTWQCDPHSELAFVPIGRSVANTKMYVLDKNLQHAPIGVEGELYISGVQVARGYLNNAELTDSVFLQDPFIPDSTMMYRTGDLARYHDDGIIEYLGRNDFQIKLRGLRIELGEIESCLLAQDQIKQAVVSTRNSGSDEILVAYLVQEGEQSSINLLSKDSLKTDELKSALSTTLPSYMIPQMFFFLSELPLTASGKIDLKALQALELQRPSVQDQAANLSSTDSPSTVLPNTESEIYLRDLWCELLDIDGVFINDNFFDIGGHSLLAVNATLQIKKDKGREVPVQAFISNTLGQIANQYLDASDEALKAQQKQQKKANWLTSLFKR